MLAKQAKIHNLILQRNFISKQAMVPRGDGDPSFKYVGYLFPENKEYFEKEGYKITTISPSEAISFAEGHPVNLFTPCDEISLTSEEEENSKLIANVISDVTSNFPSFEEFMKDLLSIDSDKTDEDDFEEDEEDDIYDDEESL